MTACVCIVVVIVILSQYVTACAVVVIVILSQYMTACVLYRYSINSIDSLCLYCCCYRIIYDRQLVFVLL